MEYRRLGKTNLQVSEIGFGGEWLERHEESESVALLKYAHSRGINMIDQNPGISSGRQSGKTMPDGLYRGISVPLIRTGSIHAHGTLNSAALPLRTCLRG